MKVLRLFLTLLCCWMLLQFGLYLKARSSRRQAMRMLQTVDGFRLGLTSKAQAEAALSQIGLKTEDEACSAVVGTCQGIAVEVANYPIPSADIFRAAVFTAARLSLFPPTYLVGNLYFYSDRLGDLSVRFSTERATVGIWLVSTDMGELYGRGWRHNYQDGSDMFVRVAEPAQKRSGSLGASDTLNLNCFVSPRGCNINGQLVVGLPKP